MQVWVNGEDTKNVAAIAGLLERDARANAGKELKAFVVFIKPADRSAEDLSKDLTKMAGDGKLEKVALTYVPGASDRSIQAYRINTDPAVRNTIFVYRNGTVAARFVNLSGDAKGLDSLDSAIRSVLK